MIRQGRARGRARVVPLALIALLGVVVIVLAGLNDMGFFSSDKRDLRQLLGDAGAVLIDDAKVAAWQPDPDHKPRAYYVVRSVDEAGFRRLAGQLSLAVAPNPAIEEAVWKLPAGVDLADWAADTMAPAAGLQAKGTLGSGNAWLRWQGGRLFVVVLRAS
ncbi:hypothetical protein BH11PSE8_BH11PSE8_00630 [soil metagenome]